MTSTPNKWDRKRGLIEMNHLISKFLEYFIAFNVPFIVREFQYSRMNSLTYHHWNHINFAEFFKNKSRNYLRKWKYYYNTNYYIQIEIFNDLCKFVILILIIKIIIHLESHVYIYIFGYPDHKIELLKISTISRPTIPHNCNNKVPTTKSQ